MTVGRRLIRRWNVVEHKRCRLPISSDKTDPSTIERVEEDFIICRTGRQKQGFDWFLSEQVYRAFYKIEGLHGLKAEQNNKRRAGD